MKKSKKIKIDKSYVLSSSHDECKYLLEYMGSTAVHYYGPQQGSDYPLYGYLSTLVNNTTILEVGTHMGGSACMLSHNTTNKVISYDIIDILDSHIKQNTRENVEFRIGNFMNDKIDYDNIDLITIDVDPHNGSQERVMIAFLEEHWKGGLLMLDDIHKNQDMERFWGEIDESKHGKFDLTDIGHFPSGTGLLNFNRYFDLKVV
jgi:predicted O-methyltransferase YrrM